MVCGNVPLLSRANCLKAKTICFPLERSLVCLARSWTPRNAGKAKLARIAIIAITISNSIRVNAEKVFLIFFIGMRLGMARLIAVFTEAVNSYFYLFSVGAVWGNSLVGREHEA